MHHLFSTVVLASNKYPIVGCPFLAEITVAFAMQIALQKFGYCRNVSSVDCLIYF